MLYDISYRIWASISIGNQLTNEMNRAVPYHATLFEADIQAI